MRRQRSQSLPPPSPKPYGNGVSLYDAPVYLFTSTFKSANLELSIRSPKIQYVPDAKFIGQSIPVFNGKDSIGGTVITNIPKMISSEHRLQISMEGAFLWTGPSKEERHPAYPSPIQSALPERLKHVFLSSSITIRLTPEPPRAAFRTSMKQSLKRGFFSRKQQQQQQQPQQQQKTQPTPPTSPPSRQRRASDAEKPQQSHYSHAFSFPLPLIDGEEVPSTMAVSHIRPGAYRGRWYAEGAQIAYKLSVRIVPTANANGDKQSQEKASVSSSFFANSFDEYLEAPFMMRKDTPEVTPEPPPLNSWSHHQLESTQPLDYLCTLSIPKPAIFPRSDKVPFYVFVMTKPRSYSLAQQLVRQAVVRVTLIRKIHLDSGFTFPAPRPRKRLQDIEQPLLIEGGQPSAPIEEEDGEELRKQVGSNSVLSDLLRRVSTRTPKIFKWNRKKNTQEQQQSEEEDGEEESGHVSDRERGRGRGRGRPVDPRHRHPPQERHHRNTSSVGTTMNSTTSSMVSSKKDKPLPAVPPGSEHTFEDMIFTVTEEGFPRRVAKRSKRSSVQPNVISQSDGVLKGEMVLSNELLNSLKWPGVSIEYFIETWVHFEDEVSKLRIPVQLMEPYS